MTFNQKSPCQRHLKHDSTFNTTCNADPRLQCGVLKKPKYLYSYTIKNFIKIKHSWKRISEQARIRGKKEFALGTSSYHPPIPPQILSLWLFRRFFRTFQLTHHSDSGTEERQIFRERRVGERAKHPRNESKSYQKKTVQNQ